MRRPKNMQKGAVLVFLALMLPILVFFAGMAVDFGRAYLHKSRLQNAADAAALAGVSAAAESSRARLIDDLPMGTTETLDVAGRDSMAVEAANAILLQDTGKASANSSNTKLRTGVENANQDENEDPKYVETYYYMVEVTDEVKMVFAQFFIPERFLPDGWKMKVVAKAWAKARFNDNGGDPWGRTLLEQMQEVAERETVPEFFAWEKKIGQGRTKAQELSFTNAGVRYNEDGSRSEVFNVDASKEEIKNMKDLFINFKQDVWFPEALADNWDASYLRNLSYDVARGRFYDLNLKLTSVVIPRSEPLRNNNGNLVSIPNFKWDESEKAYLATKSALTWDEFERAYKALNGGVSDYEKVLAYLTSTITDTINMTEAFPVRNLAGLSDKEISKTIKGEPNPLDPLFIRIESEEFNKSQGSNKDGVMNSVRDITINITADNTEKEDGKYKYRPMVFIYEGPIDVNNKSGKGRPSNKVVVNLEKDFRGIIYAPNSPVQVIGNADGNMHKFEGFIIAQSIAGPSGNLTMPETWSKDTNPVFQGFYSNLGLSSGTYNDFGVVGLNVYKNPKKDIVFLTARADVTR